MNADNGNQIEDLVVRDLNLALAGSDELACAHFHKVHEAGYEVEPIIVELDFVV